jgi:hypothetical protein
MSGPNSRRQVRFLAARFVEFSFSYTDLAVVELDVPEGEEAAASVQAPEPPQVAANDVDQSQEEREPPRKRVRLTKNRGEADGKRDNLPVTRSTQAATVPPPNPPQTALARNTTDAARPVTAVARVFGPQNQENAAVDAANAVVRTALRNLVFSLPQYLYVRKVTDQTRVRTNVELVKLVSADPRFNATFVKMEDHLIPAEYPSVLCNGVDVTVYSNLAVSAWRSERNQRPPILFDLFPRGTLEYGPANNRPLVPPELFWPATTNTGSMYLNARGRPLKSNRFMPLKLKRDTRGWFMEFFCRCDPYITTQDFLDRMVDSVPTSANDGNHASALPTIQEL